MDPGTDNLLSNRLVVSDGFNVGVAKWAYTKKQWIAVHYVFKIVFWATLPS